MRLNIASALALGVGLSCAASCSLLFPGSDYAGSPSQGGATSTSSTGTGTGGGGVGGAPPGAVARVFIVSGSRDKPVELPDYIDTNLAEVAYADVNPSGVLDAWHLASPVIARGQFQARTTATDLLVFGRSSDVNGYDRPTFQLAPLKKNGLGVWGVRTDPVVYDGDYVVPALGHAAGYFVGGQRTVQVMGVDTTVYLTEVAYLPIDATAGTLGPRSLTASLNVGRRSSGVLEQAGHIYVVGGYNDTGRVPTVEVSGVQANGSLGTFQALTDLPDPNGTGTLGLLAPTLCATDSFLYVIGGDFDGSASDIVLKAAIQPDGTLGAWSATTKLPTPLIQPGCFIAAGRLFIIGGEGATSRSDAVVSIGINGDGSLGQAWDLTSNPKLDYPRSGPAVAILPFQ